MNKTLKFFGRFFVFTLAITILSLAIFSFSSAPVYAEGSFVFTGHLELGVVSNDVKELQTLLNSKGYDVGIPDGKFGPMTKEQVILFQKDNGLTPDGIIGQRVRTFLNKTISSTTTSNTKVTPVVTPKVVTETKTQTPTITPTSISASPSLDRTLKLIVPRMSGDDVKALQTFLNSKGYDTGIPDGFFGPNTKAQVILFQKANGLFPDGSVGPKTREFINNASPTGSATTSQSTEGCASGALFNTITGKSCTTTQPSVLPVGCTTTTIYSITTGLSCKTGLPPTPVFKIIGGGSSGPSIRTISSPTITGVTIPAQGEAPVSSLSSTSEYTATIAWTGSPAVFLASTSYTATITLTPKSGYTLTGIKANFFTVAGATATNSLDSGVVTAVFPATPLKQLTISNPTITTSKTYNGNTTAAVTPGTLAGVSNGETVSVTAVATYDNKNVGTGKTITVIYTLGGADAGHYIKPADYIIATGTITQASLTIGNPTLTTSKEYDRANTAAVTAGSLVGVVSGDTVTVSASATYDSVNIGTSKTITVVYAIAGADAGNYIKPADRVEYSGVITTKQLTIGAPTLTLSKAYDGNTTAAVTASSLVGVANTEDVSVSAVATYDNINVATGKTITVVYSITGASAANYIKPVNYTTTSGVIVKAAGPAAPSAPTLSSKTDTSVTLVANALNQFSRDGATWQDSNVFSALSTSTSYTFYARVKATATTNESLASSGTVITTMVATPTFNPVAGPIIFGTTVVISSAGADAIYYTTNGTDPTTSSTNQATTPLVINSAVTVKALAVKAGFDNSSISSASYTQMPATTPSSITLAVGSTAPVGGVTNVAIPAVGGTDTTGVITGYVATTADKIKFTVVDGGSATSAITINGGAYTSGADYQIVPTTSLPTVVVTTTEAGRATAVRTFIITGPILGADTLTYGIVMGADGKKWLDRNLGATRVATSFDDYQSYGSLFQWGRAADGHQLINHTSATAATPVNGNTSTLATTDTPGDNLFIKQPASPYDWRNPKNDNLWQGVNGTNNVCPAGFRLPTQPEWSTLVSSAGITNYTTAYSSSLKLTAAGGRNYGDASLGGLGAYGYYWSSSVTGTNAFDLYFSSSAVNPASNGVRAYGFTVRCLKD